MPLKPAMFQPTKTKNGAATEGSADHSGSKVVFPLTGPFFFVIVIDGNARNDNGCGDTATASSAVGWRGRLRFKEADG